MLEKYDNKKNRTTAFGILGLVLILAKPVLVLNQPVWIALKMSDLGNNLSIFPKWLTDHSSPTYLLLLTVIIGLMLVKLTWLKLASFTVQLDIKETSKLWTFLMAISILSSIYGSLHMNVNLLIGLIIWAIGTATGYAVDKYCPKIKTTS